MATPDFAVRSGDGEHHLWVEAKSRAGTDAKWAARFRRNLLAHSPSRTAPAFLLVTPDMLFLWDEIGNYNLEEVPPSLTASASETLRPFWDKVAPDDRLSYETGLTFELAVRRWLAALITGHLRLSALPPGTRQLLEAPPIALIRGGAIEEGRPV